MPIPRLLAGLTTVIIALGLAGCGIPVPTPAPTHTSTAAAGPSSTAPVASTTTTAPTVTTTTTAPPVTTTTAPPPTTTTSASASSSGATTTGSGDVAPEWAAPINRSGELLATGTFATFTVDVYQVAIQPVDEDSMFVDPDTGKNILPKGADVVFINYVFTNTSTQTFPLSYSGIQTTARYQDWPWMQGMPGESHSKQYDALGLHDMAMKAGAKEAPYLFAPGETFNIAQSYLYQGSKKLDVKFAVLSVGADGKLDHSKTINETLTVTVK